MSREDVGSRSLRQIPVRWQSKMCRISRRGASGRVRGGVSGCLAERLLGGVELLFGFGEAAVVGGQEGDLGERKNKLRG